jgi:hypothetical protein
MSNMTKWLTFGVLIVVVGGLVVLAGRMRLFSAERRWWQTCLYFTVVGIVLLLIVDVFEFGLQDFRTGPIVLVAAAIVGGLGGALSGLWFAFSARRWPDEKRKPF